MVNGELSRSPAAVPQERPTRTSLRKLARLVSRSYARLV